LNLAHRFRWELIDPFRDVDRLRGHVERHAGTPDPIIVEFISLASQRLGELVRAGAEPGTS
jgi:hypothetical protein